MTCIVGLAKAGAVTIGGDGRITSEWHADTTANPKVFIIDDFIVGGSGSNRMIDLLRYAMKWTPSPDNDIHRHMCTTIVDNARACFRAGGFMKLENSIENGGTFLVGHRGQLFTIWSDFQVAKSDRDFACIGSGRDVAYGAMEVTDGETIMEVRVRNAIHASIEFTASCGHPITVRTLQAHVMEEPKKKKRSRRSA